MKLYQGLPRLKAVARLKNSFVSFVPSFVFFVFLLIAQSKEHKEHEVRHKEHEGKGRELYKGVPLSPQ